MEEFKKNGSDVSYNITSVRSIESNNDGNNSAKAKVNDVIIIEYWKAADQNTSTYSTDNENNGINILRPNY